MPLHRRFGLRLVAGLAILCLVAAVLLALGGWPWLAGAVALAGAALVAVARRLMRPDARAAEERARDDAGLH